MCASRAAPIFAELLLANIVDQECRPRHIRDGARATHVVLGQVATTSTSPTRPSADEPSLSTFMAGLSRRTGSYVGYASVVTVAVAFTVECGDGGRLTGTFNTWRRPEIGVVGCGTGLAGHASQVARQVEVTYC
ncbi:MAG TPA: hypothetical protein VF163_05335 [Micromonosporaceae bacterium]